LRLPGIPAVSSSATRPNPFGPILVFGNTDWTTFLAGIRRREFDRPKETAT
jgi:hypothetical protein